jgi:hypothetical protein
MSKELYDIPNVEIFGAGKHHGFGFDEAVLRQIVADTNAQEGREPYLRVGHTDGEGPKDSEPRAGLLRNLRMAGDKIVADLVGIPAAVYRAILNGGFPKRSVELLRDFHDKAGNVFPWIIDNLALLGAAHPEVKDLRDISTMYASDGGAVRYNVDTEGGWPPPEKETVIMAEEVKPATEQVQAEAPPETPKEPAFTPDVADERAGQIEALTKERDALRAEIEAMKAAGGEKDAKLAELEKRLNEMAIDRELDALGARLTPAEKVEEKVHLMELRGLQNKVRFGETEMTLYERRIAELKAREPKLKMGEMLPSGDPGDAFVWDAEREKRTGIKKEKAEALHKQGLL